MRFDPIQFIKACYAMTPNDGEWALDLLGALLPFDRGLGLAAGTFSSDSDGRMRLRPLATVGSTASAWQDRAHARLARVSSKILRAFFPTTSTAVLALRRACQPHRPVLCTLEDLLTKVGAGDTLVAVGVASQGAGVYLCAPYAPERVPSTRMFHVLSRAVWHLGSGWQLRQCLAQHRLRIRTAREMRGSNDHKRGPTGDLVWLLEAIARQEDRICRLTPEKAFEHWRELMEGGWSLVDHGDAQGHRILLVVRKADGGHDHRALTSGENAVLLLAAQGRSNKEIAFELNVTTSTVASKLRSCQAKLGLSSRRALIDLWAGLTTAPNRQEPRRPKGA